jgi:hypothetical protein
METLLGFAHSAFILGLAALLGWGRRPIDGHSDSSSLGSVASPFLAFGAVGVSAG